MGVLDNKEGNWQSNVTDWVASVLAYIQDRSDHIPVLDKFQVRNPEARTMQHLSVWEWHKKRKIYNLLDSLLDVVETGERKKVKSIRDELDVLLVEIYLIWSQLDRRSSC